MEEILNYYLWQEEVLGNLVQNYLFCFITLFCLVLFFGVFKKYLVHRLEKWAQKTETEFDDIIVDLAGSIKIWFYFYTALWLSLFWLEINTTAQRVLNVLFIILVFYQGVKFVQALIEYFASQKFDQEKEYKKKVDLLSKLAQGVMWALGLLLILSNLGIDINALIAGLGIGGIAIALASQNILGDLFASFTVYLDQPFELGDFIVVGKESGTVEKIGIKTTRLKAMTGEEIIIANKDVTSARIKNYRKMKTRFVTFDLTLDYKTKKIEKIPDLITQSVKGIKDVKFNRALLKELGSSGIVFNIAYTVQSRDWQKYLEINQEVLFKIKQALDKEKIKLAYPTQTININK